MPPAWVSSGPGDHRRPRALGISARMLADQRDEQRIAAGPSPPSSPRPTRSSISGQAVLQLLQELTTLATSSLAAHDRQECQLAQRRLDLRAAAIYALDDTAGALRSLALSGFCRRGGCRHACPPHRRRSSTARRPQGLPAVTHDSDLVRRRAPDGCAMRSAPGDALDRVAGEEG